MSILSELNTIVSPVLPVETGVFSGVPPDEYAVLTPLTDTFPLSGDNKPLYSVDEVRISLFTKSNYLAKARVVVKACIAVDFYAAIDTAGFVRSRDRTGRFVTGLRLKPYEPCDDKAFADFLR
jgi:hypothetical protein